MTSVLPIAPPTTTERLSGPALINALLGEQRQMSEPSAVEGFAEAASEGVPAQAKYYRSLLPATPPGEGEQYGFEVDLDLCSGCKACVTACHSLNGLDDAESFRDVGLLIGEATLGSQTPAPVMQHVTTACHHCIDPACLSACPVNAYEKDPVTGIVKHLDDQCFGCQYCTLACPYDVPKYHAGKGIVRKCDLCSDRLRVGEAPACVQACPHQAIAVRVVSREEARSEAEAGRFLPGTIDPNYTIPTTKYTSAKLPTAALLPADEYAAPPEHAHAALVLMLVLTQASVGAFLGDWWLRNVPDVEFGMAFRTLHGIASAVCGLVALMASTMHLGRPQYAFRAFLGLKHSWLSREIVAFGLFAPLAIGHAALVWFAPGMATWTGLLVGVVGLVGVGCSVMIYAVTRRPLWSAPQTTARFFGSVLILGAAFTLATSIGVAASGTASAAGVLNEVVPRLVWPLVIATAFKLGWEALLLGHRNDATPSPMRRSAVLMCGPLKKWATLRFAGGVLGGVVLPFGLLLLSNSDQPAGSLAAGIALASALLVLTGELAERVLFFTAVVRAKMPGGLTP